VSDWSVRGAYPLNTRSARRPDLASFNATGHGGHAGQQVRGSSGRHVMMASRESAPSRCKPRRDDTHSAPEDRGGISDWCGMTSRRRRRPIRRRLSRTSTAAKPATLPRQFDGSTVASTVTNSSGDFSFSHVPAVAITCRYRPRTSRTLRRHLLAWIAVDYSDSGLNQTAQSLLSVPLIDLAMIISYIWIWAGFAMVLIGAGLAAQPRSARSRGDRRPTEWQKFRRVTIPMLRRVDVVFVTMVINVLKVFDIILNMARSSQVPHHIGAVIYNDGFTGGIHSGIASAIAVILFLLVVPIML